MEKEELKGLFERLLVEMKWVSNVNEVVDNEGSI